MLSHSKKSISFKHATTFCIIISYHNMGICRRKEASHRNSTFLNPCSCAPINIYIVVKCAKVPHKFCNSFQVYYPHISQVLHWYEMKQVLL